MTNKKLLKAVTYQVDRPRDAVYASSRRYAVQQQASVANTLFGSHGLSGEFA